MNTEHRCTVLGTWHSGVSQFHLVHGACMSSLFQGHLNCNMEMLSLLRLVNRVLPAIFPDGEIMSRRFITIAPADFRELDTRLLGVSLSRQAICAQLTVLNQIALFAFLRILITVSRRQDVHPCFNLLCCQSRAVMCQFAIPSWNKLNLPEAKSCSWI